MKLPEVLTKLMAKEIRGARTAAWQPGSVLGLNENDEVSISFNGGKTWHEWKPYPADFTAKFSEVKFASKKKVVRMAPALCCNKDRHYLSSILYSTEGEAKKSWGTHFLKWLIDTPYAVNVEVDI
jgi:hypothetical protein